MGRGKGEEKKKGEADLSSSFFGLSGTMREGGKRERGKKELFSSPASRRSDAAPRRAGREEKGENRRKFLPSTNRRISMLPAPKRGRGGEEKRKKKKKRRSQYMRRAHQII